MRAWAIPDNAEQIHALVTIQRGLTNLRWNTSSVDVTFNGESYPAAAGAKITSFVYSADGTESNCDVMIQTEADGSVDLGDGARGVLDGWPISIMLFDPADPDGTATEMVPGSTVGSVAEDTNGPATIEARGPLTSANVPATEHFTLTGREDLGDDRCKIPIMPDDIGRGVTFQASSDLPLLRVNDAYGRMRTDTTDTPTDYANVYYECTIAGITDATTAPAYDPTPGNTTVDGTATFTARNAWTRAASGEATGTFLIVLDSLPDARASDDTWYVNGGLYVRSGPLSGFPKIPIMRWDPDTLEVTLALPVAIADIPAGTQFEIHPGCDTTPDMCFSRFDNIINLRAETFVPPPDVLL